MMMMMMMMTPCGLNKDFPLRFCVGSRVWHEISEEGKRTNLRKRWEYKNEDEDNSPNTLNDKDNRRLR